MPEFIRYALLLYSFAVPVQATDYYVCGSGSDSQDGLSHASAWKTFSKAHGVFSTLNGGDKILFCKGEEFVKPGHMPLENFNATRDNRITISSYAPPGADDLPNPTIYTPGGHNGIEISNGGNAEHKEGFVVSNLKLRGNKTSGTGVFVYNDSDFVSLIGVEIFDFRIGIHAAGANTPNPGADDKNTDLLIRGVHVHDNDTQGFLGGSDNLVIEDSIFVNNGWDKAIYNHNIYISVDAANETIRNNWLYQSAMFGGKCSGVSLVAHGSHPNLLIENNVIWEDADTAEPGCHGIAIDNGYGGAKPEQFSGVIIRGNTVINAGNMAIGCSVCQDGIIEGNTIVHQNSFGKIAIRVPNRDENSYPALTQSNNMTVRNNVVLHASPSNGVGINLGDGDAANYASVGNDVYYDPGASMVAGCESYNAGDTITVSAGVCQNSIPQNLLDAAMARAELPRGFTNSKDTSSASSGSSGSGSASAIDWLLIGLLSVLLGIRPGRE